MKMIMNNYISDFKSTPSFSTHWNIIDQDIIENYCLFIVFCNVKSHTIWIWMAHCMTQNIICSHLSIISFFSST